MADTATSAANASAISVSCRGEAGSGRPRRLSTQLAFGQGELAQQKPTVQDAVDEGDQELRTVPRVGLADVRERVGQCLDEGRARGMEVAQQLGCAHGLQFNV
ncbi:hypothetical protein QQM39_09290 [Streptomyces sp. DT2A-34]|nr:hypothetical protein [Streptomyces sp. DT2A-34]MDO0911038.1 hypothetical protein [Streptomyces sp. DT2A-34]